MAILLPKFPTSCVSRQERALGISASSSSQLGSTVCSVSTTGRLVVQDRKHRRLSLWRQRSSFALSKNERVSASESSSGSNGEEDGNLDQGKEGRNPDSSWTNSFQRWQEKWFGRKATEANDQIPLKSCEECGGSGICPECKGEGFVLKRLSDENAEKARKSAKNMATRYTAGLPKKWSYCTKCSSSRSCTACDGRGKLKLLI